MYYAYILNNKLVGFGQVKMLNEGTLNIEVSQEIFENNKNYAWNGSEIIIDENYTAKKEEKRAIRNEYLTDADKYMISDFPVSDEERALWIKYREYLRNITKDPKFPFVDVLNFKNWKEQIKYIDF